MAPLTLRFEAFTEIKMMNKETMAHWFNSSDDYDDDDETIDEKARGIGRSKGMAPHKVEDTLNFP